MEWFRDLSTSQNPVIAWAITAKYSEAKYQTIYVRRSNETLSCRAVKVDPTSFWSVIT